MLRRTPRRQAALLAASLLFAIAPTVLGAGAARADGCADIRIVGIPGTEQGVQHGYDGTDERGRTMGPEVAAVVAALREELTDKTVDEKAIDYQANGVSDFNWYDAKFRFDRSLYKQSRDAGNNVTFQDLQTTARKCGSKTKFYLVGFSQGAHIAGDLVQRITAEGVPIAKDQLAGAILLSDPAFNPEDRRAHHLTASGPLGKEMKDTVGVNELLVRDENAPYPGTLGKRDTFADGVRVSSVCILGDPICSESWPTTLAALNIHYKLYRSDLPVADGNRPDIAHWAVSKLSY